MEAWECKYCDSAQPCTGEWKKTAAKGWKCPACISKQAESDAIASWTCSYCSLLQPYSESWKKRPKGWKCPKCIKGEGSGGLDKCIEGLGGLKIGKSKATASQLWLSNDPTTWTCKGCNMMKPSDGQWKKTNSGWKCDECVMKTHCFQCDYCGQRIAAGLLLDRSWITVGLLLGCFWIAVELLLDCC